MNSLESQRVLAVLDEMVDGLRLISYITPDVVAAANQLGVVLGQDIQDSLMQHVEVLSQQPEDFQPFELQQTTSGLLRALKKSPGAEDALTSLQLTRSRGVMQLLSYFDRYRAQMHKRLTTTVEEDVTNRENFAALSDRREKAAAEKLQLEHKLKLQRLELAKQIGALQAAEDVAAAELAELRSGDAENKASIEGEAAAIKTGDEAEFTAEHMELAKQLEVAHAKLSALRNDNRVAAAAARKARKRVQQDCEAAVGEYDGELGARQKEYDQALTAYSELQEKIHKVVSQTEALRSERLAHEDALRAAAEAKKREELRKLRLEAAAYMIQNRWKVWRKQKAAEAKKAAGKGGKGAKGAAAGAAKKKK